MVYMKDAVRRVEGTETDQAIFGEIETTANLAVQMKQANRLSKLMGTVLLRPLWRDGRMELDILTPDRLDVVTGDTPHDLQSMLITNSEMDGLTPKITYSFWTADTFQKLDHNGRVLESQPNPYGVLPFIAVWSQPPLDSFWSPGAEDLVMVQDAVNLLLTNLLYTAEFQAFSLLYAKGVKSKDLDGRLATGPGMAMCLPPDGEIGFAAPQAPILDTLAAVEALLKQAAITNGLSASAVSLDPTKESGVAKIVGNSEMEELRQDDMALFARYEDQLFDLFRTVWNAHNPGRQMSAEAVLWVRFYEPKATISPYEEARTWQSLLDIGVISPIDILMERNPDLSREQAVKQFEATREENTKYGAGPALPSLAGYGAFAE